MAHVIGPALPVLLGLTQTARVVLPQIQFVGSRLVLVDDGESFPVAMFKSFLALTLLCFLTSLAIGLFRILRAASKSKGDDPKEEPAPTQDVAQKVTSPQSPSQKKEGSVGTVLVSECARCGRLICLEKKVLDAAENSGANRFIQCPHCVCMIDLLQNRASHRPASGKTRLNAVQCSSCARRNIVSDEMLPAPGNGLHQEVLHCVFCSDPIAVDVMRQAFDGRSNV
ncbi:MAG: hypothetical protein HQ559_15440 [Lentisphaerae bacterium]|nr:hypothetical protein [Lentisphaerota bacterium]